MRTFHEGCAGNDLNTTRALAESIYFLLPEIGSAPTAEEIADLVLYSFTVAAMKREEQASDSQPIVFVDEFKQINCEGASE